MYISRVPNTIYKRITLEGGTVIFNNTKNNPITLPPGCNEKMNIMTLKYIKFGNIAYFLIIIYR